MSKIKYNYLIFLLIITPAVAQIDYNIANEILSQLRCLVCDGQSVVDSNSLFALDIKNIVYEKLAAGENQQQIIDYLVEIYGENILIQTPMNSYMIFLWIVLFSSFVLIFITLILYYKYKYIKK
ncbi:cytochrome c-type biogenesis protein CcmH [Bartonella sp. DGB1]|uniref:cytochrome c-type biogenesis protein n=1 Tax=Bartonella sp. DGB1 TaxID=3239807 RepID=UPI003524D4A1